MKKIVRNRGMFSIYLAGVIGLIIAVSLVFIAYSISYEQAKKVSDAQTATIKDNITRKINAIDEVIYAMRTLFNASNEVDADEFRLMSDNLLARHSYIESSIYLKKISSAKRYEFEEEMQDNGSLNFSVKERLDDQLKPSRMKPSYFAAIYREPLSPSSVKYLGFDYLSIESYQKAINQAIDSARASTAIKLFGETYGVFIAVYAGKSTPKTPLERRQRVVGIVLLYIDATKLAKRQPKYEITLNIEGELGTQTLLQYGLNKKILEAHWVVSQWENQYHFSTESETFQLRIKTPLLWSDLNTALIFGAAILGLLISLLIVLQTQAVINRNDLLQRRNQEINQLVDDRTKELGLEKERAITTLESIADAVITTDRDGCINYLNAIAESLTGWNLEDALGLPVHEVFIAKNDTTHSLLDYREIYKSIENSEVVKITDSIIVVNKNTFRETSVELSAAPIKGNGNEVNGAVVISHDVSNARQLAQEMTHLATHDSLTGLPNRVLLLDRLVQAISRGQWNNKYLAVLFLDLDRFKLVNDTYGHDVGDELLRHVSKRLVACLREGDTVSRLGGDEFVIVLRDLADPMDIHHIAKKIIAVFNRPFELVEDEFYTTSSIGVCLYPKDSDSALELMKKADIAMYRAKASGKNNYVLYNEEMSKNDARELSLETDLRRAVEREEFELYYQPQVDAIQNKVVGVEALIRWNRPKHGLVSPLEFIPVAEETGLIIQIGQWVLNKAAEQCKEWQDLGLPKVRVSVNISAVQFLRASIFSDVKSVLDRTGLAPEYFGIELTEGTLVKDPQAAISTLNRLNEMGIKLSIDDFGTGYSSLSYLKQFCVSTLKIDRCFIKDVLTDSDDAAMCAAIISIAHNLKLNLVAEGVEDEEQLAFLKQHNCHTIQGYLFSRPLSNDEFIKYLLKQKDS